MNNKSQKTSVNIIALEEKLYLKSIYLNGTARNLTTIIMRSLIPECLINRCQNQKAMCSTFVRDFLSGNRLIEVPKDVFCEFQSSDGLAWMKGKPT